MNSLYIECYAGISGDMFVAALLDLGAEETVLRGVLDTIPVQGFQVRISRVKKAGLDVCDFDVALDAGYENHDHDMAYLYGHGHDHKHVHNHEDSHDHVHSHEHRGLREVLEIIRQTDMTEHAREIAVRIFHILGEAEAKAHGTTLENVHFHEVGAVDSIVDIISAAVCLDNLHVDEVIIPVLYEGKGQIRCQHGVLPVPVPAVSNIVCANHLHLHITDTEGELVTPTGAAIAAAIRTKDRLPESFQIIRTGLGGGKREYQNPSILRAMLIEETMERHEETDTIYKLESNVDDCTGENLGYVMDCLMEAGARDVHYTPVFMKKNRPAYQLNVICTARDVERMEQIIFRETTTIGIRRIQMERSVLEREIREIETPLGRANVKICHTGEERKVYPEYRSVTALCKKSGKSFQEVFRVIEAAGNELLECEVVDKTTELPESASDQHGAEGTVGQRSIDMEKKRSRLETVVAGYTKEDIAVAFSGGADSSLLLKLACEKAKENQTKVYAYTIHTVLHPAEDLELTEKLTQEYGAVHRVIQVDELAEAGITDNPENRCYLCKKCMFSKILEDMKADGISVLLDGTNADDMKVYRPGLAALEELGVISPLRDAGVTKAEVRAFAAAYGISVADRPASPCMATRFPYGTRLDAGELKKAEEMEKCLREAGFYNVRTRIHGTLVRIEVDADDIGRLVKHKEWITQMVKESGYEYVTADLEGFRSGSFDRPNIKRF